MHSDVVCSKLKSSETVYYVTCQQSELIEKQSYTSHRHAT